MTLFEESDPDEKLSGPEQAETEVDASELGALVSLLTPGRRSRQPAGPRLVEWALA